MQVRWNDIEDFLTIARAGQFTRAASTAGIDATTMARRLRRLESALGQTLFEQTRQGQMLTPAGEQLLRNAEAMQRAADGILPADRSRVEMSGLLRVSVSEGFGTWFVARHLAGFMDEHPRIVVDLAAINGFLSPSKRETDVAILLARPRAGQVVSSKLTDYRLRLYGSRDYLAKHLPVATVGDLREHRLIGYVPDLLYAPELRYIADIDPQLDPTMRSSSINAQYQAVAASSGIAVLPCFIGDADPNLMTVVPAWSIVRSFWIVTHRDTRQLQRIKAFRSWVIGIVAANRHLFVGRDRPYCLHPSAIL